MAEFVEDAAEYTEDVHDSPAGRGSETVLADAALKPSGKISQELSRERLGESKDGRTDFD
jgi:hypothetical protein